jgi:hypothetical protein
MPSVILNFVLFQAGWFACVLTGAGVLPPLTGVAAVSVIISIHLLRADNLSNELVLAIFALIIGVIWESSLLMTGLVNYTTGQHVAGLPPAWLIALWPLFATVLNVSLKWLKGRYWLAAAFGAVGGPLAFYAGHRLGAVTFDDTTIALLVLAAGWAALTPLLIAMATRFNGYFSTNARVQEAGLS